MDIRLWVLITITLFPGCSSSTSGEMGQGSGIIPGKVYENVKCREFPGFFYAIYLPSLYRPGDSLPVFLAFDPGASGIKPVNLYKNIAEKYGFILIGSNNSRNGQDTRQTEQVLVALLAELDHRYSTHPDRIYCTGFSGGSRVSSLIAFFSGGIRGVIGCGAGMPSVSAPIRYKPDYYGIVGDQDFNFTEMVDLAAQLSHQNLRSTVHIFHGPHAWPPPDDFEAAVRWHWFNAMHDGMIPQDPLLMAETEKEVEQNLALLSAVDLNELEGEKEKQTFYTEAMQGKTLSWWQKEKWKLDHPAKPADTLVNKRLISYLGIMAFTFSNQALASKDKERLVRMIGIYEMVDPENPYIFRLKEQLKTFP